MTDYCTAWPEGTWAHCCALHDVAYADIAVSKLTADFELVRCVAAAAGWPMALLMAAGVLALGLPFWIRAQIKRKR